MAHFFYSNTYNFFIAVLSGIFITLSLAPFNFWPLAILSCGLTFKILQHKTFFNSMIIGWLFGFGLFLSGASWVYVSIHDFGYTSNFFALILTILFCSLLAFFFAISFGFFTYLNKNSNNLYFSVLLFGAVWILNEYARTYLFSGFPWLFLGYSQTDFLLGGVASVIGVYGIGFIVSITGPWLMCFYQKSLKMWAVVILIWMTPLLIFNKNFTTSYGDPQKVSLVQANISQHEKWDPKNLMPTLRLYEKLSQPYWEYSDLIIWPEAAIPIYYDLASSFFEKISSTAKKSETNFITGMPTREQSVGNTKEKYFNSVISIGASNDIYHKQKLVPFGEYIPFYDQLGNLLEFFDLPVSTMSNGKSNQKPLKFNSWQSSPLICYEIVYPNFAAKAALDSNVLITVSNDAWFGGSIGPKQHLQMAQMRALENQRFVLRGTGTGISAIISPKGKIVEQSEQFQQSVITGEFSLVNGQTPWMSYGYWVVPFFCCLIVVISIFKKRDT